MSGLLDIYIHTFDDADITPLLPTPVVKSSTLAGMQMYTLHTVSANQKEVDMRYKLLNIEKFM